MAVFDYTAAGWKKLRPPLFPKTGMTDALVAYEKAKAKLVKAGGFREVLLAGGPAIEAFEKVEACRRKALDKAPKAFKKTRDALDKARWKQELARLHDAMAANGALDTEACFKLLKKIHTQYIGRSEGTSGGKRQVLPGLPQDLAQVLTKSREGAVRKIAPLLSSRFIRAVAQIEAVKALDAEVGKVEKTLVNAAKPHIKTAEII